MVVVDANLLVALVSGDTRGGKVLQYFTDWLNHNIEIHAPLLAKYETANALTRLIVGGAFPQDKVEDAWNNISILPIRYHDLSNVKHVVEIALALNRQNAYDAAYVALTEELSAELWTLDGPPYRNAQGLGFPVNLIS
ncbi:MAG TPA: type II toxin-antitoxin system VapC family toxin [Pyrinomonadaceae bacterium]|jgi:predicted nucleic acid-binding protein|nr:type II toxin-antitoxin system VapC family toxin [Pyrinomonadaceae bacterium]